MGHEEPVQARLRARAVAVLRAIVQYDFNHIYAIERSAQACDQDTRYPALAHLGPDRKSELVASGDHNLVHAAGYCRPDYIGYALVEDARICSVSFYCTHLIYAFNWLWPLGIDELCLLHVATRAGQAGRGMATQCIRASSADLMRGGIRRLTAFIWWNHIASQRAFVKAGWRHVGYSFAFRILALPRLVIRFRKRSRGQSHDK